MVGEEEREGEGRNGEMILKYFAYNTQKINTVISYNAYTLQNIQYKLIFSIIVYSPALNPVELAPTTFRSSVELLCVG